jgi:hypothetical protein
VAEESGISGETAIRIAKKRAGRKYRPEKYNIVACDLGTDWRVIFELKNPDSDGSGPEYTIGKRAGDIIDVTVTAHRARHALDGKRTEEQEPKNLSKEEAIELAKADALKTYGPISELNVSACELIGAWYIAFYFKQPLMRGGAPLYIIDKRTGRIIENRFYT